MWYRTPKAVLTRVQESLMQDAEIERIQIGGKSVQTYRFPAEGHRLLLVHGWGGRASVFSFIIQRLRRLNLDIVTFDAPSHGNSPGRKSNFYEFTEAISVVGAAHHPVAGILAHSVGGLCSLSSLANGFETRRFASINTTFSLNHLLFRHFSEQHGISQSIAKRVEKHIEKRFGETIWEDFHGPKRLEKLDLPVLFLHDSGDPITPVQSWLPHEKRSPHLTLETTNGLGHYGGLLDKRTVTRLADFFNAD